MKIGIDASRAFKKNKTGVEWYAYHVIKNLLKIDSDNQFVLYCDDFGGPTPYRGLDPQIKILNWPFKYLWTQGRLSLEMLFHKPDALFVPASAMPIIHPKNTVAVIHDVGFIKYPEAYSKWQLRYLKWSTKFAVKHAKKIITISEFSKQEIIKYFKADENKIAVTYLATENQNIISSQKNKKINSPYILYLGRLEKKKNIIGIIKSFAILKQNSQLSHKLVLAGSRGYGWEETESIIKQNNLQDEIIELGYIAEKDKPALYKNADLFLFPSLYEGFGLPILEAMVSGTPVITSNFGAMAEVAKDSAILVDPNNHQQIANKMKEVLIIKELQEDLIKKGKERVKEFSWKKCAKETLSILGD